MQKHSCSLTLEIDAFSRMATKGIFRPYEVTTGEHILLRLPKFKGPEKGRLDKSVVSALEAPQKTSVDIDADDDEHTIGEKLTSIFREASVFKERDPEEHTRTVKNPLAAAQAHGNKPSRGAQIDAELKAEDERMLKEKEKYE